MVFMAWTIIDSLFEASKLISIICMLFVTNNSIRNIHLLLFYRMLCSLLKFSAAPSLRSLHTSRLSPRFVQDIYKKIDYQAPYPEEDKLKVLTKLNLASENELNKFTSKKVSKVIVKYRDENGTFDCVEQLLNLDKIEKFHIAKLCDKVLSLENPQVASMPVIHGAPKFLGNVIPRPSTDEYQSMNNPIVTGVHLSLQGFAFAVYSSQELMDWGYQDLPFVEREVGKPSKRQKTKTDEVKKVVQGDSQTYFEHHNLLEACKKIWVGLPKEADYFIFEEPLPILPQDPYLKHKINLVKIRTALMTMMMLQGYRVHTMKPNVSDALFGLKKGNERISVQEFVKMEQDYDTQLSFKILSQDKQLYIREARLGDMYYKASRVDKEHLLLTLLKSVAFDFLCKKRT